MAGFAVSLAHNLHPAEFAQISRNITNQQSQAAQAFTSEDARIGFLRRATTVDDETIITDKDRDADGHDWGPPQRRKRDRKPQQSELELLAGEGAVFDWII